MRIVSANRRVSGAVVGRQSFPGHSLTLCAKMVLSLKPGLDAVLVAKEEHAVEGDVEREDVPFYASDFAIFKPRADYLLVGTCYPPEGNAVPACRVSLEVDGQRKSLMVLGDHHWKESLLLGSRPTDPKPFTSMPMSYSRSYGGASYPVNPVGIGHDEKKDGVRPCPNISYLSTDASSPQPAGFGPLHRDWKFRAQKQGTYRRDYLETRWPAFPEDFDWSYFNAAPEDQQIEGYLRGDEEVRCENMHPEHSDYRFRLPGQRVRCFLNEGEGEIDNFRELPLNLDTLWIDLDTETMVLVWRGVAATASKHHEELKQAYFVVEDLSAEPEPLETHKAGLSLLIGSPEAIEDEEEPSVDEQEDAAEPDGVAEDPEVEQLEAQLDEAVSQAKKVLEEAGVDPVWVDRIRSDGIAAVTHGMLLELGIEPVDTENFLKESRMKTAQLLEEHGLDSKAFLDFVNAPLPSEVDEEAHLGERPEGVAVEFSDAGLREHVEQRVRAGESLSGEDFTDIDLSGADLRGADLRDTLLTSANLSGVNLSQANLSGANLQQSNLSHANLNEATVEDADLSGADLSGARLDQAALTHADLTGAILTGASLEGAHAMQSVFNDARLSEARFKGAELSGASFFGACIDQADFSCAQLADAIFDSAQGSGANFSEAKVANLRAGECCVLQGCLFSSVDGEGANFSYADLRGSSFRGARLSHSSFDSTQLEGVDLACCELKRATFAKAVLHGASLCKSNLFQANFEDADLSGAKLNDSNLYEAEFLDATLEGIDLTNANVSATKLAGR